MWWGDACVAACGPAVRLLVHQTEVKAIDFKQATGMGGEDKAAASPGCGRRYDPEAGWAGGQDVMMGFWRLPLDSSPCR